MQNIFAATGRLATDLTLKTKGQTQYVRTTLAVRRDVKNAAGEYETDFIPVVFYNGSAENVIKYATKGSLVDVEGRLTVSRYTDTQGDKRTSASVLVNRFHVLDSKDFTDDLRNEHAQKAAATAEATPGTPAITPDEQQQPTVQVGEPTPVVHQTPQNPFVEGEYTDFVTDDDLPF